ncbi:CZB domain-containing protein [bacterium]|nr:CZB domain-containing protein [bacterium]NUN47121.1 CZB domain-containing protein [bacterium]
MHALLEEIENAIAAHELWKERLMAAIETGHSVWAVDKVSVDDQCAFGKWIHMIETDYKDDHFYTTVRELHAHFHKIAGIVLNLALSGFKKQATEIYQGEYQLASQHLLFELHAWKKSL